MSFADVVKRSIHQPSGHKPKEDENVPRMIDTRKKKSRRKKDPAKMTGDSPSSSRCSSKASSRKSTSSRFSQLNTEIVQFQGMVRQLETLVKRSGDTPEDQWKSRILLRSAEEADRDIGEKLAYRKQTTQNALNPNVRASYQKLDRDYKRAHDSFQVLSKQYKKRQKAAITQLEGEHGWMSPDEVQQKLLAKHEEEFFERKMKEREAEVSNLNKSMHQVNDIYKELGRIVQSQQEQIDKFDDHVKDSKANTKAALDEFQRKYLCSGELEEEPRESPPRDDSSPRLISEEDFRWSMPFETIGEDIKEVVQKDIMGLGNDIISMTRSPKSLMRAKEMLQCASTKDVYDHVG